MKALIGDIGRYALYDGPGIRTTVFFKGCAFRCAWCHNPEFLATLPEILFNPARCINCGECAAMCPEQAIIRSRSGTVIHRKHCSGCGQCADICPSRALMLAGHWQTVDELVEILLRDRLYYEVSGGGVTFSGGEPTIYMDFIQAVLKRLRKEHVHTVMETNGYFSMQAFQEKCLDLLDLIFFDLKMADEKKHFDATGKPNHLIWANLAKLQLQRPGDLIPRIPVIPGYTATESNIRQIAQRLEKMGITRYSLLPYHPFGHSKASYLGRKTDPALPHENMTQEELDPWRAIFGGCGLSEYRDGQSNIHDQRR